MEELSRKWPHITSVVWIQHSAQCVVNLCFVVWNFLDIFPNLLYPQLVKRIVGEYG